ncbi:MAG: hypothetical protein AABZ12_03450 [Planctomycetota bacterium]
MRDDLKARLYDATQRYETWQRLRAELPGSHERCSSQMYQFNRLEAALEQAQQEVHRLESFSISGLMDSLLGRKEAKLSAERERLSTLQAECDEAGQAVGDLDTEVRRMEEQLKALQDAETGFQTVCDEAERCILDAGGPECDPLRTVVEQFQTLMERQRRLKRGMDCGKQVLDKLNTLSRTVSQAKGKMAAKGQMGAIPGLVHDVVASAAPRSVVKQVQSGLQRFAECINEADDGGDEPDDVDLRRLGTAVVAAQAQLEGFHPITTEASDLARIKQDVSTAISHLKPKLKAADERTVELQTQRLELIQQAP